MSDLDEIIEKFERALSELRRIRYALETLKWRKEKKHK